LPTIAGNRQRMLSLLSELAAMGHVVHFCHIAADPGDTRAMEEMLGERFQETRAHYRITGQDRSYLAELLLEKGYTVHGIVRRTSHLLRSRIEHLRRDGKICGRRLFLHYGDLSDSGTLNGIIAEVAVYAPLKVLLEKRNYVHSTNKQKTAV